VKRLSNVGHYWGKGEAQIATADLGQLPCSSGEN